MELNPEQRTFWEQCSYLLFPGYFRGQVDLLSEWIAEVSEWPEDPERWLRFYERDQPEVISRLENFAPYHSGMDGIFRNGGLLDLLEALAGEPVYLYKDRINFKLPGGGEHAAHQDGVAYEAGLGSKTFPEGNPYLSVLISVDGASRENGCFQVVEPWPLEKLEILPMERTLKTDPRFSKIAEKEEARLNWISLETEPGDMIIFTERIPHRSFSNQSMKPRRILYGVYNPKSAGDLREAYFSRKRKNLNDPRYLVGNPHAPS